MEKTLIIIKPDSVSKGCVGDILKRFENSGLKLVNIKMIHMTKTEAESFYDIHKERDFFEDLTTFMSSGPAIALTLEGEDAVSRARTIIGATNPREAMPGTIRRDFAESIDRNAIHGSDSIANAIREVEFFFTIAQVRC